MEHLTYILDNQPVNASITLYHKTIGENRLEKWERHFIEKVFWTGGKGASFNRGYEDSNNVTIRVWTSLNDLSDITFDIGDIVVKGNIEEDITKQDDLSSYSDVYNLMTIIPNINGDIDMDHIHLGGK